MPTGKLKQTPNLIEIPPDYTHSIDQDKVTNSKMNLGHVVNKVTSPNLSTTCSRDLGYYRQTEAVFHVIRENQNLLKLSEVSTIEEYEKLKHLQNRIGPQSTKDNQTRADSSILNESLLSPSRFLAQKSSKNLQNNPSGMHLKLNLMQAKDKQRPQTGVPTGAKRGAMA